MPKDKVSEWSSTPANNTDIGGVNIAEGCAPSGINNAIRELMAQVKDMQAGSDGDGLVVGGTFTSSGAAVFSSTVSLGGSATATTQSASDDSTKVATTAFVKDVALPDTSGNGIVARTGVVTVANRTITAGTGITVTNGDGVSGNPTIANSGVTSVNGNTGDVTTITAGTAVSASGTSVTLSGIPSGAKRVTLLLNQLSTNGTSPIFLRLGTSGGIDSSTGYTYTNHIIATGVDRVSNLSAANYDTGFCLTLGTSYTTNASLFTGQYVFSLFNSNLWVIAGQINNPISGGAWTLFTTGRKSLGSALSQIQLYTYNGTDTFDAGTVNILYE